MYEEIIMRHKPRGWRVRVSKRKTALADKMRAHYERSAKRLPHKLEIAYAHIEKRVIVAPAVSDPFTLELLLHEFGHVTLKHWGAGESVLHREEFEADRWAMEIMRLEGVPVPLSVRRAARAYVSRCMDIDEKNGNDIHGHVARWIRRAA